MRFTGNPQTRKPYKKNATSPTFTLPYPVVFARISKEIRYENLHAIHVLSNFSGFPSKALWIFSPYQFIPWIHVTLAFYHRKKGICAAARQNQQNGMCAQRRLRSAWASAQSDQSSLCGQWVAKDPRFHHADSEDSDLSFCWFCNRDVTVTVKSYLYLCTVVLSFFVNQIKEMK